jgi:hypothetical protein
MTDVPPHRRKLRIGFLIHGGKVWLSELLAMTVVSLLLLSFMATIAVVFVNYFTIKRHDVTIATLRKERIEHDYAIESLSREARCITLLRSFAGGAVPDRALCEVAKTVSRSSALYGYDPLLLLAVIRVESVFDAGAYGRFQSGAQSRAFGLMQLRFETASEIAGLLGMPPLAEKDLFNPEVNMVLGVAYLTQLIAQFRSFKLGLMAYNQGPGTIYQTLSAREPLSMDYYRKVLRSYYHLRKIAKKIEE